MQPLFYAALAFATGIATVAMGPAWLRPAAWPLAACAAAAALAARLWAGERGRHWPAALALLACLGCGAGRAAIVLAHPAPPSPLAARVAALQPRVRDRVWLTGYLRDDPDIHAGEARLDLEVETISTGAAPGASGALWPVRGGVRLYNYRSAAAMALGTTDQEPGVEDTGDDFPASISGVPSTRWPGALGRLHAGDAVAVDVHLRPMAAPRDPGVTAGLGEGQRQDISFYATLSSAGWRRWIPGAVPPRWEVWRARLWSFLAARLDRLAPPGRAAAVNALLRGMLLGDNDRLGPANRAAFQIDGVYHLVVVAGLHIGILAALLLLLLRGLRLPRPAAEAATLLLLALYAWVIVGRTPTLRALLMLAIYFGARRWYRRPRALNAVGAAALFLLAWHPGDLYAPGWQMSLGAATLLAALVLPMVAATSGPRREALLRLAQEDYDEAFPPRLAQFRLDMRALATRLAWIWTPLGRALAPLLRLALRIYEIALVSAVLQVGFAAFNAEYFHRANPWAVVANLVLVPAAGLLIPLAWLGMAVQAAATALRLAPVASATGAAVCAFGAAMLRCAAAMAAWPGGGLRVPSPPPWFLACFAVALAGCITVWILPRPASARRPPAAWAFATAGLTLLLAVIMAWAPFAPRLPPGLSATILDVGQGDSIFVSFPDGRTLLVDAGPRTPHWDSGEQIVAPFLWSLGLHRVDALLLTHAHMDHIGGMPAVLRDFRPGEIWVTETLPTEAGVTSFLRQAIAQGARLRRCEAGEDFIAGAVRLQVLLPPPGYRSGEIASNDDSMVVRLRYGDQSMLLTGDAEAGGERWMVNQHLDLSSQLLKVGHHGSRTSTTPAFLAAVAPRVAVISDGAGNIYGHPAPDVVARLEQAGIRVFRTDTDGAVQCRFSGTGLAVYLFRPPFAAPAPNN